MDRQKKSYIPTIGQTEKGQTSKQMDRWKENETFKQMDRQKESQTYEQTDKRKKVSHTN
jgi:hypothetical protein